MKVEVSEARRVMGLLAGKGLFWLPIGVSALQPIIKEVRSTFFSQITPQEIEISVYTSRTKNH